MFIINWLFDKLGYMPKASVDTAWPFPAVSKDFEPRKKPVPRKRTATKKPSVVAKTTRTKKAK